MSETVPWVERPTVTLDAGLPHRTRYDSLEPQVIADAQRLLSAVLKEIPDRARKLAPAVRLRTKNRFHAEFTALARMANSDWKDVLLANISYDLVMTTVFGCSTIALPTASGPVVARNMDWWPEDILAQSSYLLRVEKHGEFQFANAGWPGAVGVVTGLSGNGFAVVLNAVVSPEGQDKTGYPFLLHLRRVLEDAKDFDAALKSLQETKLTVGGLITLVGTENDQRVVIERTPKRAGLRWGQPNEALIATNDYRELYQPESHAGAEIYESTCHRYSALCEFFGNHDASREVTDSQLLYVLSDERVVQGITAQHIIMRPRQRDAKVFIPRRLAR